jgi:hypothetical protein
MCVQVFSQLGGLQLDRDVRSLVAAAGELTSRPVRDKFARLTQVRIRWLHCAVYKLYSVQCSWVSNSRAAAW